MLTFLKHCFISVNVGGEKIFEDHAPRYFELGIPVIPLSGKIPLVSDWNVWSERAQTEEELDWLIQRYPRANIGAVMGLWATAVDIDTDNEDVLRAIPYSPFRRRGKKGSISLYKPTDIPNRAGAEFPVEFLNHGRQIVLPPSIHPETGQPYLWVGEENLDLSQLPTITLKQIQNIERVCMTANIRRAARNTHRTGETPVCLTDPGRNNRLVRVAYAMACDETDADEAVERLMDLDNKEHEDHPRGPWFSDPSEPHKAKNPRQTAQRMYSRALRSVEKKGHWNSRITLNIARPTTIPVPVPGLPIPKPRGIMKLFQDYCNEISVGNQDALGLGGAVALMAAISSNRFRTEAGNFDVWPNLFVINLAHSGFGKEVPQRTIDELLMDTELLGAANYKSGSSIVMGLKDQQERLDLIDECSMLLKAMCSTEDYKSEIVDILSSLYTKSNSRFLGFASRADGPRYGACWNPCVNILGSTTPQGFRGSVSKDMAAKGLMPRFLTFWQKDVGEFKGDFNTERAGVLRKELSRMVNLILSYEKPLHPNCGQRDLIEPERESEIRYMPELVPMDIFRTYYEEGRRNPESFESAFKNRFAQHVSKLALLDALSLAQAEIGVDSIEWAHSVVLWQWETVKELYELASAENLHEREVLRVKQFLKKQGTASNRQVARKFPGIFRRTLADILNHLIECGDVEKRPGENSTGPRSYTYIYIGK
jgi:hypothetical protein